MKRRIATNLMLTMAVAVGCAPAMGIPTHGAPQSLRREAPRDVHELVIDTHAHVFNAWDLPLVGFIRKTVPILGPLASVMISLVRERSVRTRSGEIVADEASGTCLMDLRGSARTDGDCSEEQAEALYAELMAENPDLGAADGGIRTRGLNPADWAETGARLVGVVSTFHRSRAAQAQRLIDVYPRVDLFTPAMVDMEGWGGEDAELLPFPDRLEAMASAVLTLNRARPGVMHPIVSFNPRHGIEAYPGYLENYHALIEAALLEQGFIGVKVYPSFGYLPLGNDGAALDEPYRVEHAAEIDRELRWLYAFAERHGVPVMAHCSPDGVELGERSSDVYAHPKNWEPVLREYPQLHLNLGHFGSGKGLLVAHERQDTWPFVIAEMMERHPNLYSDLSNGSITEPDELEEMFRGLEVVLRMHPVVRERLMYGSDWFMLMLHKGSPEYFDRYDRALSAERFGEGMRAAFLGGNAVKYLALDRPATRDRLLAYYRSHDLEGPRWLAP